MRHLTLALAAAAMVSQLSAAGLPASAGRVYVVAGRHPAADDTAPGTAERPLRTLSRAAELAQPGDSVSVQPGIYREWVRPARGGTKDKPIVYQAVGEVIVKGSEIWTPQWTADAQAKGVYHAPLDAALFPQAEGVPGPAYASGNNPYLVGISVEGGDQNIVARPAGAFSDKYKKWQEKNGRDRLPLTLGQLFADGKPLFQRERIADVETTPGTWIVNEAGDGLIVHFEGERTPGQRAIELTVRNRIFAPVRRGLAQIQVRGFVFEHCANQGPFPQGGAVSVRSGRDWVVDGNTIRYAATIGIDVGSESWGAETLRQTAKEDRHLIIGGGHLIRNNTFCDNGLAGLAGWNVNGLKIIGNVVTRNNTRGHAVGALYGTGWWEQSGIKLHNADALIEGNLVYDNDAFGIWIDNGFRNARMVRNVVYGNRLAGIFLELGTGPCWIENNVIVQNRGDGIYTHDASNVIIAQNLIAQNSHFGVWMHVVSDRKIGQDLVQCSEHQIVNNLIVGNYRGAICLPMATPRSKNNRSDENVFFDGSWMDATRPSVFRLNRNNGFVNLGANQGQPAGEADAADPQQSAMAEKDLSLKEWTALTGRDTQSVAGAVSRLAFIPQEKMVQFDLVLKKLSKAARVAETLKFDWSGQRINPDDPVWPGPWQGLSDGRNQFSVWPVAEVDRTPPALLAAYDFEPPDAGGAGEKGPGTVVVDRAAEGRAEATDGVVDAGSRIVSRDGRAMLSGSATFSPAVELARMVPTAYGRQGTVWSRVLIAQPPVTADWWQLIDPANAPAGLEARIDGGAIILRQPSANYGGIRQAFTFVAGHAYELAASWWDANPAGFTYRRLFVRDVTAGEPWKTFEGSSPTHASGKNWILRVHSLGEGNLLDEIRFYRQYYGTVDAAPFKQD